MSSKQALITGVTGQDGAYLTKLLLEKGYHVIGAIRRNSHPVLTRLQRLGIEGEIERVGLDLLEVNNINRLVRDYQPDEIYNLAAQSFVGSSWDQPVYVGEANALAVTRFLEAIRTFSPHSRFYQASTSEMFGHVREVPQNELTAFHPRSPYGVAKAYGHYITVNYRESFDMHASSGILFNHESPLRGEDFVTRKISMGLARLKVHQGDPIALGNLSARRDWGFAGEYVEGMWRMLQQDVAEDYVLATGTTTSIRDFTHHAALAAGFEPEWQGDGRHEMCRDAATGLALVRVDDQFFRPAEVDLLQGDATKAATKLGWRANVTATQLAEMMVEADLALLS